MLTEPAAKTSLPIDGPAAPPRSNGELVFAAPWESRLFGLTLALLEKNFFSWSVFQQELVEQIRVWQANDARSGAEYRYYERWQAALEIVLEQKGICIASELEARAREYAARPHGHDH